MFSHVSRRMASENGTKELLEERQQSSPERQIETPTRGLCETDLTKPVINQAKPKKMGRSELSDDVSNTFGH